MYEEGSYIPFIEVPNGEDEPQILYVSMNRKTGDFEPDENGDEVSIWEMELKQFCRMDLLAEKLDAAAFDAVRAALGLEPRAVAIEKGRVITASVAEAVSGTRE